jgi:hypothetical protein
MLKEWKEGGRQKAEGREQGKRFCCLLPTAFCLLFLLIRIPHSAIKRLSQVFLKSLNPLKNRLFPKKTGLSRLLRPAQVFLNGNP